MYLFWKIGTGSKIYDWAAQLTEQENSCINELEMFSPHKIRYNLSAA